MKNRKYYDLYELRELTESIYGIRQAMGLLNNCSYEYKELSKTYDVLWEKRNKLEAKIMGEDGDVDNYWIIN